jgi:adenylyltransferase/sulfurtransferase
MIKQVNVEELKSKMDAGEKIVLVDCREPDENQYCRIEGAILIPLSEFSARGLSELDKDAEIYIHCHHGGRSQRACEFLEAQGFKSVANITGGIDAWSLRIDPKVPRY